MISKTRLRVWLAASLAAGWIVLASIALAGVEGPEDLVLGPGDKVSIAVYKRPELSGEFRILPSGVLSIPYVQSVPAAGRTLMEVQAAVVEKLRDEAFILDPRVSVNLVEARPIVVAGDVRRPGTYPYQIGMTAQHAIATAGGARTLDLETFAAFIEVGRLREKLRQSEEDVGLARVRQARLLAERDGLGVFTLAPEVAKSLREERSREAFESEKRIMTLRTDTFASQMNALGRQVAVFDEEIRALTDQSAAKEREGVLIREEIVYVEDLLRRGLTPRTSRLVELQRLAVQIEGEKRQIAASIAKAKQEIARIDQTRINLKGQRDLEISVLLKETEDSLSRLSTAIEETRLSLREARDAVPGLSGASAGRGGPDYTILRTRGRERLTIAAQDDTLLQPGDLVDVPRR